MQMRIDGEAEADFNGSKVVARVTSSDLRIMVLGPPLDAESIPQGERPIDP